MKKLLSVLLAMSLGATLLAGCSGSSDSSATTTESSTAAESSTTTEEASATSDWPTRPIEIVIPYTAGGDTDFNARAYIEGLSEVLGVSVIASNVTGSSGSIASRQVKDADPDGYEVLFFHSAINVNEAIGTADFGIHDLDLACIAAKGPGDIVVARSDLGVSNLDELVAYTQENPGTVKLGIETGTMVHVQSLMLQAAGADVVLVDVGGAADRVAAMAGGHIDVMINAYGTISDYLETGEFVALAQTNGEVSDGFPEIIPAIDQGYDMTLEKHYFFAFPEGTPQDIIDTFAAAVETVSTGSDYADTLMSSYRQEPFYADADEGYEYMDTFMTHVSTSVDELLG